MSNKTPKHQSIDEATQKKRFISMINEKDYFTQTEFFHDYNNAYPENQFANQSQISKLFSKFGIEKSSETHTYKHYIYYTEEETAIHDFILEEGEKVTKIYSSPFFFTINVNPGTEQYLCKLLKKNWKKSITALIIGYGSITVVCTDEDKITTIRRFIHKILRKKSQNSSN